MKVLAIVMTAGLVATAAPQDPARPVFQSAAHGVSVDVAVFDGKNVVTSLTAKDFQVLDNGVEQTVTSVDLNRLPIDLKLVFDTSGSISPEGLERYRRAMRRVADALQPNDRCEIVAFTARVQDAALRQSPPIAIDLQRTLPDGTSFFDAVSLALVTVPSSERRQIVIVLSDAQDNASFFDEEALLAAAKLTDAVVYTVLPIGGAINTGPYVARLQSLSLLTGGRLMPAFSDAQIASTLNEAIQEFRHSYVLRYSLRAAEKKPGWHKIVVKIRSAYYTVRVREGYFIG
jgi:VWFA-related protein